MLAILSLVVGAAIAAPTAATIAADRAARETVLTAHAEGAQIYQCKPGPDGALVWSFREPIAVLMVDGRTIGRHYAGPHWVLDDGSLIQGRMVISAPGASGADVALLKLAVIDNNGLGALNRTTLVYRVNTHGGNLAGACPTAGMLRAVAYTAEYVFAK